MAANLNAAIASDISRAISITLEEAMVSLRSQLSTKMAYGLNEIAARGQAEQDKLPALYKRLSQEARAAMLSRLEETLTGHPIYRPGDRESGKLKNALRRYTFIASDVGIRVIDGEAMSTASRQWYRLNFGARPIGAGVEAAEALSPIRAAGVLLGDAGIIGPPDGSFSMPFGTFRAPGSLERQAYDRSRKVDRGGVSRGIDAFMWRQREGKKHPHKGSPRRASKTEGIQGVNFMTPGTQALGRGFGQALNDGMRRITAPIPFK